MVQPVNHDFGSEAATTVLGGLKGGLFYGTLGTIASTVIGAAVGAAILAGGGAVLDFMIPNSIAESYVAASTLAYVGAGIGGLGGLAYGGAVSFIGGGIAGIFEGRSQVGREQGLANAIEQQKSQAQGQVIAAARGDAIEQGAMVGYMQGMQDAQAAMANQMQAPEHDCTPCKAAKDIIAKHEAKHHHGHVSHVDKVTANAAEPSLGRAG